MESLRVHDKEGDSFILFGECVYGPMGRGQRRVSSVLLWQSLPYFLDSASLTELQMLA